MAKKGHSPSIQGLSDLKRFIKSNKARLAAGLAFFIIPWLVNFFVNYELAILAVLVEIGILVYYRKKRKRPQTQ